MKLTWSLLLLTALWGVTTTYGQIRFCSQDGDVQIYQTNSLHGVDNAGRVEICMDGVWGTIAADSTDTLWSEKNAQVACIQAGFSGVLTSTVVLQETIPSNDSAEASVPIHLSGVQCNGSERSILNCPNSSIVSPNVSHLQDVYAVCQPRNRSNPCSAGDPSALQLSPSQFLGVWSYCFIIGYVGGICTIYNPYRCWKKRHSLTKWCYCDSNTTTTVVKHSDTESNLTYCASLERQPKPEPEPDPVSSQPSDPSLSKAPPLFYQAASKFCPHDLKADLPPPYPDGPGHRATASHAPQAAVYTSLTVPDYPQTPATASDAAYPPSWSSPA